MRASTLIIFNLFLLTCLQVHGFFTIVGSRTFVLGSNYELFVTTDRVLSRNPQKLLLKLVGNNQGEEYDEEVVLDSPEKLVTFELEGHPTVENFTLTASLENSDYLQSVKVVSVNKNHSALIQTDKAFYKPSDKIKFRLLVLDAATKPYSFKESLKLNITDSNGVLVFESVNNELENLYPGVYGGQYKISDQPPLGKWKIDVRVDAGEIATRTFEVSENVLPRFSAHLITKSDVLLSEQKIKVVIYGEYTFGEFVHAAAVVTANVIDPEKPEVVKLKKVKESNNVSAKKTFEFDLTRELGMKSAGMIRVEVVVEEKLTGKKVHQSKIIVVHERDDNKIEIIREENRFKPGFPFSLIVAVKKYDGEIETSLENKVKLEVSFHMSRPVNAESVSHSKLKSMNNNLKDTLEEALIDGAAKFTINVPKDTKSMAIKASYKDVSTSVDVTRFPCKSREYLKVQVKKENPQIEASVLVQVESTKPIKAVYYAVTGQKIGHNKINSTKEAKVFEFAVKVRPDMSPSSRVIVYYIHDTGEIIYDSASLPVERSLKNELNISLVKESSPGLETTITVTNTASPGAFVGLLAVDKRVLLQKASNDIDKKRVLNELMSFESGVRFEALQINGTMTKYLDFDGITPNAFILTDANVEPKKVLLNQRFNFNESDDDDESEEDYDDLLSETQPPKDSSGKVRKDFPETWIFEDFILDDNGQYQLRKTVPDSITSYILTGFMLDSENGLGLAEPQKLYVKQNFFIKLNLPYSIRWGEILRLEISVFNYVPDRKNNLSVDVTLFTNDLDPEFEFLEKKSKCAFEASLDSTSTKIISVAQNSATSTYFYIKPLKAGKIKFNIKAIASQLKFVDAVEKEFLVEQEGITHYSNKPLLIDLTKGLFDSYHFGVDLPTEAIPKSVKVGASVIGDLLGPALLDVSKLIKLPTGCGEQRLVTFVPTIVATKYLQSINKLSDYQKANSQNYLRSGYNQILEQKNSDGSFNLWGYSKSDSIWLTAYILKCLGHVKNLISINDIHIYEAMTFLKKKQKPSGSFSEYGPISHRRLQGGLSNGVALTAYVLVSFLENPDYNHRHPDVIHKALNFIDKNVFNITDNYAVAISSYAFVLGNHMSADDVIKVLLLNSIVEEGKRHWDNTIGGSRDADESSLPLKIEIASYALLALLKFGKTNEALEVMQWLVTKRNAEGGFYSTQDTVIGLQALAEIAKIFYHPNVKMRIKLSHNGDIALKTIDETNALKLQNFDLPANSRDFSVNANGQGKALLNIWSMYNMNSMTSVPAFDLKLKVLAAKNHGTFYLKACVKRLESTDRSMVVMEISLPSGYVYDSDSTMFLKEANVKKVETRDQKSFVILYFDEVVEQKCPEIRAIREQTVEQLKNSPVKVYDYYNPDKRAVDYYSTHGSQSCQ